jgi:nicotinate-nucleotide--dimethylbenzimidazole phosphoribosyltransferase
MVLNFLMGGAAINVFAETYGMQVRIVDSGVNHRFSIESASKYPLIDAKIAMGTRNFLYEPAMTADQCQQAVEKGAELARAELLAGSNILGFGEMGIGNTSSAAALFSVISGLPVAQCIGRGTGVDNTGLERKLSVITQAIQHHQADSTNYLQVLATFGGFEIAMMTGAMLAAAKEKTVLIIDGFIATCALLVAAKMQPEIIDYCVFAHCSNEAGHQALLDYLQVKPLLHLELRLGEGTGAALVFPLIQAAVNFLGSMASFESANVSREIKPHS